MRRGIPHRSSRPAPAGANGLEGLRFLEDFIAEMRRPFPDAYCTSAVTRSRSEWKQRPSIQAFMQAQGLKDNAALPGPLQPAGSPPSSPASEADGGLGRDLTPTSHHHGRPVVAGQESLGREREAGVQRHPVGGVLPRPDAEHPSRTTWWIPIPKGADLAGDARRGSWAARRDVGEHLTPDRSTRDLAPARPQSASGSGPPREVARRGDMYRRLRDAGPSRGRRLGPRRTRRAGAPDGGRKRSVGADQDAPASRAGHFGERGRIQQPTQLTPMGRRWTPPAPIPRQWRFRALVTDRSRAGRAPRPR